MEHITYTRLRIIVIDGGQMKCYTTPKSTTTHAHSHMAFCQL